MRIKGKIANIFYPKKGRFFANNEFSIFILKKENGESILCMGETFPIVKNQKVILEGKFGKNYRNQDVFKFYSIEKDFSTEEDHEDYLKLIIGEKTAIKLIEHFQGSKKLIEIIMKNPERMNEVKGIGEKRIEKIVNTYRNNYLVEELFKLLKDYGFSLSDCTKIIKTLGNEAIVRIKKNPYILMKKVGFDFKKVDSLALGLGIKFDAIERNISAMFQVIKDEYNKGNTFVPERHFFSETFALLKDISFFPTYDNVYESFRYALEKEILFHVNNSVYSRKSWLEEEDIRNYVKESLNNTIDSKINIDDIKRYESMKGFSLGEEQIRAVLNSSKNKISIITGGPGTGKTTILDCLLFILKKYYREDEIALCSPTGKAARRMSEITNMPAYTIHNLLKVEPVDSLLETFRYNENNKLPYKMVIVDEASMINQFMAASLLRALRPGCQIVFVGDIEQLPPVGAGYFLRDLIKSNVPTIELKETYRQKGDSTIIKLSKQISNGKISSLKPSKDFGFTYFKNHEQLVNIFIRGVNEVGLEEVVIISPQNKGMLGVKQINLAILNKLIPNKKNELTKNGWIFRKGCKVMQTRNNNEIGLVNGQTGYITDIDFDNKIVEINFDGKLYEYDSIMLEDIVLAYAITVHKSQGSEWKYVIQIVSNEHCNNTKSLIYTGITRAKEKLIIIGDLKTFLTAPFKKEKEPLSKIL